MTEFGEQLRIRRVVAGLSRVKLGRLAGLSECTIKLLEKGKSQPTEKTLLRLLGTKKLRLLLTDLSEPDCHRMRKYFWTGKKDYARPGNAAGPSIAALLLFRIHRRLARIMRRRARSAVTREQPHHELGRRSKSPGCLRHRDRIPCEHGPCKMA